MSKAARKTRAGTLAKKLNQAFPGLDAVTLDDFYGDEKVNHDGIWFRGSEDGVAPDGYPFFDYWREFGPMYHRKLEDMVEEHGFFLEPYDAGTLMAHRE
jgi:hypothetical protein